MPATVMVCFVILADVLATEETLEGQRRFEDQNSIRTSADNVEPNKVGQSLFNRVRRALKNNTSTTHDDFERRLKTMEERYAIVLFLWFPADTNAIINLLLIHLLFTTIF